MAIPPGGYPAAIEPPSNGVYPGTQQKSKPCKKTKPTTTKRQSSRRFEMANTFYGGIETSGLSQSAIMAWLILWLRTDATTGLVRISYETLARKIALHERQAKRLVRELLERGFMELVSRGGTMKHTANEYRLHPVPLSKGGTK